MTHTTYCLYCLWQHGWSTIGDLTSFAEEEIPKLWCLMTGPDSFLVRIQENARPGASLTFRRTHTYLCHVAGHAWIVVGLNRLCFLTTPSVFSIRT